MEKRINKLSRPRPLVEAHPNDWIGTRCGETFPLLQKVQIEIILPAGRRFLFPGTRSIIIPRCGDLYFHLLLQYWFIRNIVAFKITTFVCGYLFEMMSKYCITFYVHYLLVVDWSPFNVICMCSCQVTFTQIWKKKC